MLKVCLKRPPKSVKFQEKDEIPLNYVAHSAPQISGGLSLIGQSITITKPMCPAMKVARIAGASRHSRLETEPRSDHEQWEM